MDLFNDNLDLFNDKIISNLTLNTNNKKNTTVLLLDLFNNVKNISHILEDPSFKKIKDKILHMTLKELSTKLIKIKQEDKQQDKQEDKQEKKQYMI